ncbi:pap2 superfamily protein [Phlyctema vagabunda]|uniref:Pap2 superfamily protein n=1 Tax=Phlyctema vagabunda TaxID=108571 RepID=A0ABR4PF64_9HELO
MKDVLRLPGRLLLHIYRTLLNRHSLFGLLRHILINMTFILIWITTFKNAWRIDPAVRPKIRVNWLEREDHIIFDITIPGLVIQFTIGACGYVWMYYLTRRSRLSVLAALPPFLLNILHAGTHELRPVLDVMAWMTYGVIHFISPFLAAFWLWLFASPGVVSIFAWCFGMQNCLGIITHLAFPTAAPWYGDQYGYPLPQGNYSMLGSPAGLVRVDEVFGTHIYEKAFKASPLVFGAFPSLHGAFSTCCFFFVARYSRRGAYMLGVYVLWQFWATMYLRHHWRLDLLGGLTYSAFVFSLFSRSLIRMDRAYATGVSGGNGWQRLWEGTILQYAFDKAPEQRYESVPINNLGEDPNCRTSMDAHGNVRRDEDLESAWVEDLGATWRVKENGPRGTRTL